MSFYFIANNIHFTLELIGALVFFVMTWLAIDAGSINKNFSTTMQIIGFCLIGVWQLIAAFSFGGDFINFIGFFVYIVGLALLVSSFLSAPKMATVSAIILIPAFVSILPFFQTIAAIILGALSYFIYSQAKREFNKSLVPLYVGFGFLTISALTQIATSSQSSDNILWYVAHIFEIIGFISFIFWIWQYLKLRLKESLVLIFISMTLFVATIVTLAFSTILISKIEQETRNNLLTNAKVFDFSMQNLEQVALSGAKLISSDTNIINNVSDNNSSHLQTILTSYLDSEKLGFLLVTDRSGVVIMRAHSPLEHGDSVAKERAVEEALIGNSFVTIESSPSEKFSIRASSPILKNGKVIGATVAGFPLDNVMVDKLNKITGLDATLYQEDTSIATTALTLDGRSRLTGVVLTDNTVKDNVLGNGESATTRIVIKDIPYLASYVPIKNSDKKIVGMFSAAKPQADILEIANSTNRLTLITITVLLLLLAFPLYLLTKRFFVEE